MAPIRRCGRLTYKPEQAIMNVRSAAPMLVALCLTVPALIQPASAAEATVPSRTVRVSDLDLTTPAGVRALHQRIKLAAWQVCRDVIGPPVGMSIVKCQLQLIDGAVADANIPALTALVNGEEHAALARR
jgi:UrcA family protein